MIGADGEPRPVVLRLRDLGKTFLGTRALANVFLEVRSGEIAALLGGNGSGKSTLIKVLAGVHHADPGGSIERVGDEPVAADHWSARHARDAGLLFVHQSLGLFPGSTVAENLALGRGFEARPWGAIEWRNTRRRAQTLIERFGIRVRADQLIDELGPAERTMVAIARALQDQEDATRTVLFLDEPTASLPAAEVDVLHAALRRYAAAGQTIVYVSHRLDEVQELADRVVVLKDGRITADLPTSVTSTSRLVELITGLGRAAVPVAGAGERRTGEVVLSVRDLGSPPLRSVSFEAHGGELLGVAGLLGSGRTELLRCLFGDRPFTGEVVLHGRPLAPTGVADAVASGVAYVPESRAEDAVFADESIGYNLSVTRLRDYWQRGRLRVAQEGADGRAAISAFLVKAADPDVTMATLSGGNQQKVVLARWLARRPRLLLLDEPTQGVDIGARQEIYALVRAATATGMAVVVVSSDFEELAAVCDRVLVLRNGRIAAAVSGAELTARHLTDITYDHHEAAS